MPFLSILTFTQKKEFSYKDFNLYKKKKKEFKKVLNPNSYSLIECGRNIIL